MNGYEWIVPEFWGSCNDPDRFFEVFGTELTLSSSIIVELVENERKLVQHILVTCKCFINNESLLWLKVYLSVDLRLSLEIVKLWSEEESFLVAVRGLFWFSTLSSLRDDVIPFFIFSIALFLIVYYNYSKIFLLRSAQF